MAGARLSPRHAQVAELVMRGYLDKQIAHEMGLSLGSVKMYLCRIYKLLEIRPGSNQRVLLAVYWLTRSMSEAIRSMEELCRAASTASVSARKTSPRE